MDARSSATDEPESPEPDVEIDEDALFEELEKDDDDLLSDMRERRMQELRAEFVYLPCFERMMKQQEMAANQHGTYENILSEKEVLKITTSTDKCVVHFYHKEFRRCQIMDRHLGVRVLFYMPSALKPYSDSCKKTLQDTIHKD
ncbi:hypothetical protein HDU82_004121 [Entophlyctis luteolus]|nr:hypothetical protein HDU82_004121 [Entophlyctis luteolus]